MQNKKFPLMDENISHTDERRLAKESKPESSSLIKNEILKRNIKKKKSFVNCFGCEIFYEE